MVAVEEVEAAVSLLRRAAVWLSISDSEILVVFF